MGKLADIAAMCGASLSTVSYVLSGKGNAKRISPATQEKVLAAAREYLASDPILASSEPAPIRLAFFWPDRHLGMSLAGIMDGLNSAMRLLTSPVSVSICPFESSHLAAQQSLWTAGSYDAAIIASANWDDLQVLSEHPAAIPVVIHNRLLDGYSCVSVDQREVGRLLAVQALAKGADQIVLAVPSTPMQGIALRTEAFRETCAEQNVDVSGKICTTGSSIEDGYALGQQFLRSGTLPKVIVCMLDMLAYGLIRALVEAGIQIGSEVEVLSAGTSIKDLFARSTPPLTVVDLNIVEVTMRSLLLAVDLATRRVIEPTRIMVQPEIIYRESSPAPLQSKL